MPKGLMYTNELQIGEALEGDDNFQHYLSIIASQRRNSKYFQWSEETLKSIIRQANEDNGVGIYPLHNSYSEFPIGRTVSSKFKNGQAETNIYIQKNLSMRTGVQTTNELIDRMNALTVDSFSTGTNGGDFICDLDGTKFEFQSDGFFYYSRQCGEGHRLGQKVRMDGKERIGTATVKGEVNLVEVSVVGDGAVPDAKIIRKLQKGLSSGEILTDDIAVICELNNFPMDGLCDSLGLRIDPGKPNSKTTPYRVRGKGKMDPELMQRENEKLEKELEERDNQIQTLKTELQTQKDDSYTSEEYDALVLERDNLKTEVSDSKEASQGSEELAEVGRNALTWAREFYVEAQVSLDSLDADGEAEVKEYVSDKADFLSLVRTARASLRRSSKNRAGGKQSANTPKRKSNKAEDGWFPSHINQI